MWWDLERERLAARHSPWKRSQESTPFPGCEKNDDVVLCRLAHDAGRSNNHATFDRIEEIFRAVALTTASFFNY